ncbi:MAG: hypothetical protein Fur0046_26950 [Cyanobacteria bacterium J069]|nr:MAG: hypothetical protein D6742_13975 [Cyanobacteria bacterium J069]
MKEFPATQPAPTQANPTEIRAIQERLQAIRAGQTAVRSASPPHMVEMFPARSVAAIAAESMDAAPVSARQASAGRAGAGRVGAFAMPERDRPTDADVAAATRAAAAEARQAAELRQAAESLRAMSASRTSTFSTRPAPVLANPAADSPRLERSPVPHPEVAPPRAAFPATEVMRLLEVKADEINQLSAAQEAAMLELKAIAQKLERDWKTLDAQHTAFPDATSELPSLCAYLETEVPLVQRDENGAFVVTKRPVDLFQAEREAEFMAHSLRHRVEGRAGETISRGRRSPTANTFTANAFMTNAPELMQRAMQGLLGLVRQALIPSDRSRLARSAQRRSTTMSAEQSPLSSPLSMQTSAALLIGSAIARIGADLVLAANPGFWLPVALLIVAPAALAIYRTTVAPHTSVTWGYRIFLILLGLLIGGRVI